MRRLPSRRASSGRTLVRVGLVIVVVAACAVVALPLSRSAVAGSRPRSGAPVPDLGVVPTSGAAPLPVRFDGSGSSDPNGTVASWDLAFGDSTADARGTGAPPAGIAHTYTTAGTYTATLTATNLRGQTGTSLATVVISP